MMIKICAERFIIKKQLLQYVIVCFLLTFLFFTGKAQNLVPNPGFESFEECPPYPGQIHVSKAWDSPNNNTTDYFHRCSPVENGASVPDNLFGIQEPYEGEGYVGIRAWIPSGQNPIYREYLGVKLSQPLQKGKPYFVSFQVSPADLSTHLSDGIGAYFSTDTFENERLYPFNPHIRHPKGEIINDFNRWIEISGTYIANGGETYMIIGNFEDDEQTLKQSVSANQGQSEMIYYYVDAVEVIPCNTVETAVRLEIDTVLCQGEILQLSPQYEEVSYLWPDGSFDGAYQITSTGQYPVVISHDECKYTDTVGVNYIEWELPLDQLALCEGDTLDIDLPYDTVILNSQMLLDAEGLSIDREGEYIVEVKDQGCEFTDTLIAYYEAVPAITTQVIDTSICVGEVLTFNPGEEGIPWLWGESRSPIAPEIQDSATLEAVRIHSCYEEKILYSVSVNDCKCEVLGSNVLTPNSDGYNDSWKVEVVGTATGNMEIFDRWGKRVHQGNIKMDFWDGTYRGQRCDPGVYFWRASYLCEESGRQSANGYLMLAY